MQLATLFDAPAPSPPVPTRLDPQETESQKLDTPGAGLDCVSSSGRFDDENDDETPSVLFRHSGWRHNRSLVRHSLTRTEATPSRRSAFHHCGADAYVFRSKEDPNVFRIGGSACHDRWCQPCALGRATTIAGNVLDLIRGKEIRFLTLTIRGHPDFSLKRQLAKLYNSFAALRRRKLWKKSVDGGVAFVELKWSTRGHLWHPHLHCLMQGRYLDQERLKRVWYKITTDSFEVKIRKPDNDAKTTAYVTKYASKPLNNTFANHPDLLDEAIVALAGRKLCLTYGTWRGLKLTATVTEGCWEIVGSLDNIISRAAVDDVEALRILRILSPQDLTPILARASPLPADPTVIVPSPQLRLDLGLTAPTHANWDIG